MTQSEGQNDPCVASKALPPPEYLYVELTRRCNLRCEHCDFYKSKRDLEMSDATLMEIVSTFSRIGGRVVVTCGGESSLTGERFWTLHRHARAMGLESFSVTNGTRITDSNVDRWLTEGPSEITVSLDSSRPEKHNDWRGLPNWHQAVKGTAALLNRRVELEAKTKIYLMTIVAERNYRDLPDLYYLAYRDLGVDKLKLNIAQPTFGFRREDTWFAQNAPKDPDELIRIISSCDKNYGIKRNPQWLSDVHMYCSAVQRDESAIGGRHRIGQTDWNICNSGDRNIWISYKGTARLCPSAKWPGERIRSGQDIVRLWRNAHWREQMRGCRDLCGISHSVRREPSLLRIH